MSEVTLNLETGTSPDKIKNGDDSQIANQTAALPASPNVSIFYRYKFPLYMTAVLGTVGYGAYKLNKLPDHANYEGYKVVGVAFGGLLLGLSSISWSGNETKNQALRGYASGAFLTGSLSYAFLRLFAHKDVNNSFKIAGGIGLAVAAYMYYKDRNRKSTFTVKQDLAGTYPQSTIQLVQSK